MIAIVDDEKDIVKLVSKHLERAGFKTIKFYNGYEFLNSINKSIPDLVILDLMLPDIDGIEICKSIKNNDRYSNIKIIMLTAKADESDKVIGLELGADDYIVKPFSPKELVARVKAVLRRNTEKEDIIKIREIKIDTKKMDVYLQNRKVELTTTEFKILLMLAKRKGWVFSREQILRNLWGDDKIVIERSIDVHIRHLREKLGKFGKNIKNVRGAGYKLE